MSATYQTVLWNRQKRIYDGTLFLLLLGYGSVFTATNFLVHPEITQETLVIRLFGTLAIFLLHLILVIGPLARLHPIFLPILYNRRHLGVTMFCIAAVHGIFSIIQFHSLGNENPILSVFRSNTHYESYVRFPFQTLGFFALIIFFLMAITSHDFWLHQLSPKFWKSLHMMVYVAYALVLVHVLVGVMQYETSPLLATVLGTGLCAVITLHWVAGKKESRADQPLSQNDEEWVRVGRIDEIKEKRAKVVCVQEERIAIFKYDNKLSAVSNVCKHQNGPLGEGRLVDGCITCPWHGYQYLPHNGSSPPPFQEKVATYEVKVLGEEIWINPRPFPEGHAIEPAIIK